MSENNPSPRFAVAHGARLGVATRAKRALGQSIADTDARMKKLMVEMRGLEHLENSGTPEELALLKKQIDLAEAGSQLDRNRAIWQGMEKDGWQYSTPEGE